MDIFFEPLLSTFRTLKKNGVSFTTPGGKQTIKFEPRFGLFDLPAKAPILNMHQYNGNHGCSVCLHPGIWNGSRYYLPTEDSYPARTTLSIRSAAEMARKEGSVIDGIKGDSVLTGYVDLVNDVPIDYMHCILEGVTKWLVKVHKNLLPVCAIAISCLLCKCVRVQCENSVYVVNVPNNYEHH